MCSVLALACAMTNSYIRARLQRVSGAALALGIVFFSTVAYAQDAHKVLVVSHEQTGILQTGGLAHATTGLVDGLNADGIKTEVLMPHYTGMSAPSMLFTGKQFQVGLDWHFGHPQKMTLFSLHESLDHRKPTLFLKHDQKSRERNYFDNQVSVGKPSSYGPIEHIGESFGAFAKAAADFILTQRYDIVILNDWPTGPIAMHLLEAKKRGLRVPKTLFAIHNLAFQGVFPKSLSDYLGLTERHFSVDGMEYWGQMNFLKAGLQHSDMIYTVSPQYANEIATPRFGAGLDGVIRQKRDENKVTGILNGIDVAEWDPSVKGAGLEWSFDKHDISGKAQGKAELQKRFGFEPSASTPLFALTSRLAEQKGFAYLIDSIEMALQHQSGQWIVLGDGDTGYVERLQDLARRYPHKMHFSHFSSLLEKQSIRYSDFFVNGAWFEPSGLNQMFALANGTIPVVSASGGLLDSVRDGIDGILFSIVHGADDRPYDVGGTILSAYSAFERAHALFKQPKKIKQMRLAGMSVDNSWGARVKTKFRPLFEHLLRGDPGRCGDAVGG